MTVLEIINRADTLEPNAYSADEKIRWLSNLDGKIFEEVIKTHEGGTENFTPYSTGDEELLLAEPYGEDVYTHYIAAMIAAGNSEASRYNQQIAMYNANYGQWFNWYNRTHRPLPKSKRFVF